MGDRKRAALLGIAVASLGCGEELALSRASALEGGQGDDVAVVGEQVIARSAGPGGRASGSPTVLFVNFDGGAIAKVANKSDALANESFIGGGTIPPFKGDAAARAAVIAHLKTLFAAYNLTIVTTRPTSGEYDMAMVGGWPSTIGRPSGPSGVAPLDCGQKIPRDISFTFSEVIQSSLACSTSSPLYHRYVAETIAHESGHSYGLPHSGDGCDLMSYSSCSQPKKFLDKTMALQADAAGQCGLSSMNSHALLLAALGPAPAPLDKTPPAVTILAPAEGAQVGASVQLVVAASDEVGVVRVEAREGSALLGELTAPPYQLPLVLAAGEHSLTVRALDAAGNVGSASVSFRVAAPLPPPPPPARDAGPSATPDHGLPPPAQGGFGAPCAGPADCTSGLCARVTDGAGFCTASCADDRSCPSGASCQVATSGASICGQPGTGWMTGGCALAPAPGPLPALAPLVLLVLLALLLLLRRRA